MITKDVINTICVDQDIPVVVEIDGEYFEITNVVHALKPVENWGCAQRWELQARPLQ